MVTLVKAVVFVLDIVLELLSEVSGDEVRLEVSALAGEMFAIGSSMMEKIIMPKMERNFFEFIYLMYNCITYLNIPSLLCKIDIIDESSIFLYIFLNN